MNTDNEALLTAIENARPLAQGEVIARVYEELGGRTLFDTEEERERFASFIAAGAWTSCAMMIATARYPADCIGLRGNNTIRSDSGDPEPTPEYPLDGEDIWQGSVVLGNGDCDSFTDQDLLETEGAIEYEGTGTSPALAVLAAVMRAHFAEEEAHGESEEETAAVSEAEPVN